MNEASGWCEGCLRTLDEIGAWGGLDDGAKRDMLRRLGARKVAWRALRSALPSVASTVVPTAPEPGG